MSFRMPHRIRKASTEEETGNEIRKRDERVPQACEWRAGADRQSAPPPNYRSCAPSRRILVAGRARRWRTACATTSWKWLAAGEQHCRAARPSGTPSRPAQEKTRLKIRSGHLRNRQREADEWDRVEREFPAPCHKTLGYWKLRMNVQDEHWTRPVAVAGMWG